MKLTPTTGKSIRQTIGTQHPEDIVDVGILAKLERDRLRAAFDPDFNFRIETEVARCFLGEVIDALVKHAGVFPLLAGHALLVHKKQPEIGEYN